MANIDIEIAGRRYNVACANGEEDHLRSVAALVDRRARDATQALGSLTEARHLLYAALLLADDVKEARAGSGLAEPDPDPEVAEALEGLAGRIEKLADRLEAQSAA
jgi:cell division protein ZapA